MKKAANNTSIRVFCRLRPLNRLEREQGGQCCVQHTDKAIKVKVAGVDTPYDFCFDGIFGHESRQPDVFNQVAKPVIDGLIDGYNGTIFAYGQTSSGKTYTMEGPDLIESEDDLGIVPRMMKYLFDLIMNSSEDIEFNVKVSFLELYNEKLQDLLDPRKNNLQIKEDKSRGIFVQDVTEVYVSSAEQMKQVHKSGSENKTTAATRMNERSSRSHSIFILNVHQKDTKTETTKQSKLYFVDLAGSEKIAKTNVTGQQLEEAKNINKSLTSLGLVINALTDKDKGHVPYRDSKLTRMLQESLGGNSQTSLILACSMCTYNDKETVDTLRFGNRAKSVKNTPIVNAERSAKELTILLTAAEKKIQDQETLIEALQQQLENGGKTEGKISKEPESAKSQGSSNKDDKVANSQKPAATNSLALFKYQMEISELKEQLEDLQGTNKDLETELTTKNQEIYDLNGKILQFENQINEFTNKNVFALEEYQVQYEKLYHENQEKAMLATKFKRAISRLKSDLNFMTISKHLKVLEGDNNSILENTASTEKESASQGNKDELIMSSIQKTIEILEDIEKEIDENNKKGNQNEEMANLIEAFMKNSPTNSATKDQDKGISEKTERSDLLANGEDEEKNINWNTESSIENKDSSDSAFDNSKIEGDNEDDLVQKMQLQFQSLSEDDKMVELQTLVMNQRKTINSLTKTNNELSHANQKHQASQDKQVEAYKNKLEELQKANSEKIKEYENKLQNIKTLFELKMNELEENKTNFEKYVQDKEQMISELKEQNEKLQSLIADNDAAVRNFELENTLKEVMIERKKLAENILILRKEADEKDDLISTKTGQIELLQNNLGLAAKEIKMLKQFKPANAEENINGVPSKESSRREGKNKNKNEFTLFDKHVVKPIRGGGGDANSFARNNFLVFDKPGKMDPMPEDKGPVKQPKTPRAGGLFSFGNSEEVKSSKSKEEQNFKKFDEILKQKGSSSAMKSESSNNRRVNTEIDEDEEYDLNNKVQSKLKDLAGKAGKGIAAGQKNIKSLMSGMKNLFS